MKPLDVLGTLVATSVICLSSLAQQQTFLPAPDSHEVSSSSSADVSQEQPSGTTKSKEENLPEAPQGVKLVIGLGFSGPANVPDYALNSSVLSSTHHGAAVPQYMLGLLYEIPYLNYTGFGNRCWDAKEDNSDVDDHFRCRPFGVFVSAKFSTESNDAVNGITFGISHKLTSSLSLLFAGSLTPFQEPSQGFIKAAAQTLDQQLALSPVNSYYQRFDKAKMLANEKDAFDGFSTNLMTVGSNNTLVTGPAIYNGPILTTRYDPGFLFGVALTPDVLKLLTNSRK